MLLLMSKLLPVRVIKDKELVDVDYTNRAIQLPGTYTAIVIFVVGLQHNFTHTSRQQVANWFYNSTTCKIST